MPSSNSDKTQTNAFSVLMAAAIKNAASSDIPCAIAVPKNQKERLRNELLGWLSEKNCVLPSNCGKGANFFVTKFCDMLYYLHGQYSKIEFEIGKVKNVPKVFKTRFSGFNVPEKNKHGKRTRSNLSDRKLEEHSVSVRESIQSHVYLNQAPWQTCQVSRFTRESPGFCSDLQVSRLVLKISRKIVLYSEKIKFSKIPCLLSKENPYL
jgi:hypothetical protein